MRKSGGALTHFFNACVLVFFWATSTLPAESLLWKCKKQGALSPFLQAFLVSLSDDLLFGLNVECRGDNFGGYLGVILVILAVQASIWTQGGPRYQKRGAREEIRQNVQSPGTPFGVPF